MQDGYTDSLEMENSSLVASPRKNLSEWMEKWGDLRRLDMMIQAKIEKDWCNTLCGLWPASIKDFNECFACHDRLFRRYMKEIGKENLIDTIETEFRYVKGNL